MKTPRGGFVNEIASKGMLVIENVPKPQIHAEKAPEKGSTGTLGCILGPEPCPKVTPTLPLVPAASSSLGWDSPRDAEGVGKKDSAETLDCGVGLARHPMGEGTGDRPRGFTEHFTGSAEISTPEGSPATHRQDFPHSTPLGGGC